jgi:pentapeptide MXKDX repeat protein
MGAGASIWSLGNRSILPLIFHEEKLMKKLIVLLVAGCMSLVFAGAFAADDMMKKDGMSQDSMKKDSMKPAKKKHSAKKDTMGKDSMSKDSMGKDQMKK